MRKLACLLLALVLCVGILPAAVFAESAEPTEETVETAAPEEATTAEEPAAEEETTTEEEPTEEPTEEVTEETVEEPAEAAETEAGNEVALDGATTSYLDQCTLYPCYLKVKVTYADHIRSLPCTYDTNNESLSNRATYLDETYTATGLYKDTKDTYWYEVTYKNEAGKDKTGYVYGGYVEVTEYLTSDVTIEGANYPTVLAEGEGFHITGTVSSTYTELTSVTGIIGPTGSPSASYYETDDANGKSYTLKSGGTIDSALKFRELAVGNYKYVINASVLSYYTKTGTDCKDKRTKITLLEKEFVVAAGKSVMVTFNPNGGTCSADFAVVPKGGTISVWPTAEREGYTFNGWYNSNFESVSSDETFSSDTTIYAWWKTKSYTISYDANGGSNAPDKQTKGYGDTLTLSSTVPTREGYTFLGWVSGSTTYSPGGSYTANESATLYALWEKNASTPSDTRGDLNGDGKVDIMDVLHLLKYVARIITSL